MLPGQMLLLDRALGTQQLAMALIFLYSWTLPNGPSLAILERNPQKTKGLFPNQRSKSGRVAQWSSTCVACARPWIASPALHAHMHTHMPTVTQSMSYSPGFLYEIECSWLHGN